MRGAQAASGYERAGSPHRPPLPLSGLCHGFCSTQTRWTHGAPRLIKNDVTLPKEDIKGYYCNFRSKVYFCSMCTILRIDRSLNQVVVVALDLTDCIFFPYGGRTDTTQAHRHSPVTLCYSRLRSLMWVYPWAPPRRHPLLPPRRRTVGAMGGAASTRDDASGGPFLFVEETFTCIRPQLFFFAR